jgi:hypothetical protein
LFTASAQSHSRLRLHASSLALVILVVCPGPNPAKAQDRIWDRVISSQPFDTQPFRQVRVPEWLEGTIGCGYTLSMMDTAARTAAASHGVTISEMGFVNPFFACYDSQLITRRSADYPPGRIERDIAEYKNLGVTFWPCILPVFKAKSTKDIPTGGGFRPTRPRFPASTWKKIRTAGCSACWVRTATS